MSKRMVVKQYLKRLLFGLLAVVSSLLAGEDHSQIVKVLQSSDVMMRTAGLKAVLKSERLQVSPQIQNLVITLARSETKSSTWGEQEEYPPYQRYYALLIDCLKNIALVSHREDAWDQLITCHYNEQTEIALWISSQPQAIARGFYLVQSDSDEIRSKGVDLLATGLDNCRRKPHETQCRFVLPRSSKIIDILRKSSEGPASMTRTESVWGLSLCGSKADIPFLNGLVKPDSNRWFVMNVHDAVKQIQERDR